MEQLIEIIDEITKYGLLAKIEIEDKEKDLEKHLVKLYAAYFEVDYVFDEKEYEDFEIKELYPNLIVNVKTNFADFGWYHSILNIEEIFKEPEIGTGDATDDLSDIIYDLLEVKWRMENN
ncbi:MAG: DUF5063 domain-containing protein, partial [Bacteroidota bacterium]